MNPTVAVHWNKEERRQEPIPWANLAAWRSAIDELSAVRRDYQLVVSGRAAAERAGLHVIEADHSDLRASAHRHHPGKVAEHTALQTELR